MATRRSWRSKHLIALAVAGGLLIGACSSDPERVLTESDADTSAEVTQPTETMEAFLAGTVWIVDDLDTITPYGPDSDAPSLTFTREAGLVLTVTDPCGSLRLGLTPNDSGSYDLDHVEDVQIALCDNLYGSFFAEATTFTIERNGVGLVVRSGGSVLRASHVVSDSAHPDDPSPERPPSSVADIHAGIDVPWCADVVRPQPRFEGNLRFNQNPDPIPMGVLNTYAQEHPETFAYISIDRDNGGVVVIAFTDDPHPHYEALLARAPSEDDAVSVQPPPPIVDPRPLGEQDFPFDVVQVDFTETQLAAAQQSLRLPFEDGLVASGSGNSTNRVKLDFVDPPQDRWPDIVASLPEQACVDSVAFTPYIPADVQLLGGDGSYVGPSELIPVGLYVDERPSAEATSLTVFGVEMGCNSGQAMGDRIRGPVMEETDTRIVIAVGVVPNPAGGMCPSNPVETFVFELSAPVGDRLVWNAIADEAIDGDPYR